MRIASLLALLLAILIAGCGVLPGAPSVSSLPVEIPDLGSGVWAATSIPGAQLVAGREPWFMVDGSNLSGSSGCNDFGATLRRSGARIEVGDIAATKIACPGGLGAQEVAFFAALRGVERLNLVGDRLSLGGSTGDLVFRLVGD